MEHYTHADYYTPPAPRALPQIIRQLRAKDDGRAPAAARRAELVRREEQLTAFLAGVTRESDLEEVAAASSQLSAVRLVLAVTPETPQDELLASQISNLLGNLRQFLRDLASVVRGVQGEISTIEHQLAQPFSPTLNPTNYLRPNNRLSTEEHAARTSAMIDKAVRDHFEPLNQQCENKRARIRELEQIIADGEENLRLVAELGADAHQ